MNLEEKEEKAKKKKILVVLTGGTIGSVCTDGVRGIAGDSPYLLLREFRAACPTYADCEFEVINPCNLLSENLSCEVWETLYAAISEKLPTPSPTPPPRWECFCGTRPVRWC